MNGESEVRVTLEIAASASTLWKFFTDPVRFASWMGPGAAVELREGGELTVRYPGGVVVRGEVLEVEPERRVAWSWRYEGAPAGSLTRVIVLLEPVARGTRVTLRHMGVREAEARRGHLVGWRHYVGALAAASTREEHAPAAEEAAAAYTEAWRETDDERRRQLLERCWSVEAVLWDQRSYAVGREELCAAIGAAQRFAPGARLERAGSVALAHHFVRWSWRIVGPSGEHWAHGTNVGELDGEGRLQKLVVFWDPPAAG
jgi:uncharacterized protein YndB with AHSA1/START domain